MKQLRHRLTRTAAIVGAAAAAGALSLALANGIQGSGHNATASGLISAEGGVISTNSVTAADGGVISAN